jgi:KDO2-lipid IV(A) lauroyltransferase
VTSDGAQGRRKLEAPHRRLESAPPRVVERGAVVGYRAASAVLAHVPPRLSRGVIATAAQGGYLAWPAKRRAVNANFGHVLGLRPDDAAVRRMALRAYREYARYMVELMRLPSRPVAELANGIEGDAIEQLEAVWRESGRALIVVAGHVGNNEAVGAALAGRGYPVNVIADDSTFPELFELLRQQREAWGVKLIPWRNLRDLYGVLRRNEVLALLIDWGYRDDGIPVRLFGSWTTLPAGPAALAARSGALIAPLAVRRTAGGRFKLEAPEPFAVPSSDPADLQQATQRIADALEATVRAAPEQWYSFKPIWPSDAGEALRLEARAAEMLGGGGVTPTGAVSAAVPGHGAAPGAADGPVPVTADGPVPVTADGP